MTCNEMADRRVLAGQCQCGSVRYEVVDQFVYAFNCHCSNCRRATGLAFKPFAGIECDKLRITKGEDNFMIFGDENGHDTRCKAFGSYLYSIVRGGAFVHVAMGTLIDDPTIRRSDRPGTSSSAPMPNGLQSPTACPNTKNMWWSQTLPFTPMHQGALICDGTHFQIHFRPGQ
mgnify:FL=1